ILAVVYGMTMACGEILGHTAAVSLVFPIAQASARDLGVSFLPFVLAIMIAGSCCFATPMGYQTNLMVYGPGGYRFSDYLKAGGGHRRRQGHPGGAAARPAAAPHRAGSAFARRQRAALS